MYAEKRGHRHMYRLALDEIRFSVDNDDQPQPPLNNRGPSTSTLDLQ